MEKLRGLLGKMYIRLRLGGQCYGRLLHSQTAQSKQGEGSLAARSSLELKLLFPLVASRFSAISLGPSLLTIYKKGSPLLV